MTSKEIVSQKIEELKMQSKSQFNFGKPSQGAKLLDQSEKLSKILNSENILETIKYKLQEAEEKADDLLFENKHSESEEYTDLAEIYEELISKHY